ncbi:MAG: hypothetical protein AAFN50_15420 [Pseudomonadota bacterium]
MSIMDLWQPILLASVLLFVAGAVIWMAMPWHKTDWNEAPNEDAVRSGLKGLAPGMYNVPHCIDQKQMGEPAMQEKFKEGPVAFITVMPSGIPAMGGRLVINFLYNLAVAILCAYMLSRTTVPGADYLTNFRITGTVAFAAFGLAYVQEAIWFGRPWSVTAKNLLDALIYALLVGGAFGWLA